MSSSLFQTLAGQHDLRLPRWGAYTTRYMGISHLPDLASGLRFDLSVFPAIYRRHTLVPNVKYESGFHLWEAAPDMSFFSVRYELLWKDQLYCDVSFSRIDEQAVLIASHFVNNTAVPYSVALHYMASMHFPPLRPYCDEEFRIARVKLPPGAVWIDGMRYDSMHWPFPDPRASLSWDGFIRGQVRDHGFVDGSGVQLGGHAGLPSSGAADTTASITYTFKIAHAIPSASLIVRYRLLDAATTITLTGAFNATANLPKCDGFNVVHLTNGPLPAGESTLVISAPAHTKLQIDGLAIVPTNHRDEVRFEPVAWNHVPQRTPGPREGSSLLLKYEHADPHYGIAWDFPDSEVREFYCDDLDILMKRMVLDHVNRTFRGAGSGHYTNMFLRPIVLQPGQERTVHGVACCGDPEQVALRLRTFDFAPARCAAIVDNARKALCDLAPNPAGSAYQFSQARMAATIMTNVVYPVHTRGTYIRHYSPGRWWDSLYTWDAGFIALGLADLDTDRAVDCLNCYVTEPGERDAAFIHHGSPVPVQLYAFLELFNRTGSMELARYFFPRIRQYHRFLAGRHGSSTTRNLKSNLLRTWDYFYNSGGWDDYPPQVHVHAHKLTASVAPVANTCHAIRTAKILRMTAIALGEDPAEFDQDIEIFTRAVQQHAWDEQSGYFGYVCHDDSGQATGILRHPGGSNFNMGLDGVYPLVAGICTPDQERRASEALMSDQRMWSSCGLSTVDQSAPYYRSDGYWNGAVWMPHQWFFWKALLGLGRADDAWRIASTALEIWKREVDESYHCFEHFMVQTGRGAGWHQFGALSSPVVNWYAAYHRPGSHTTGYDAWIEKRALSPDRKRLSARLSLFGDDGHTPTAIAVLAPARDYTVTWNGEPLTCIPRLPGTLEITLPSGTTNGELVVQGR